MMKLLFKFLLPFCFLLLGWYAHTGQHRIGFNLTNIFEKPAPAGCSTAPCDKILSSKTPSSSAGSVHDRIKATEIEEDDELEFFKKYAGTGTYCITFFCTQTRGSIHHFFKSRLPLCEHISYSSSCKFILHRAIRI